MAIFDAGLTATLSREFARTDNSHAEKMRIFKTLEFSYFILIGICIIIIVIFSRFIASNWLILKTFSPDKVSIFLKIVSFDIGFQFLLRFYMGGLLGLEKQVKANIYVVCWGILRNGLVVLVILFFPTLELFFIWQTFSTVIFAVLLGFSLNKTLTGHFRFNFQFRIERVVFRRVWRFAGGMLLISLVASLNTQMDKLAISKLLPIDNLGYYTLAVSLAMGIMVLVNPISAAILPRFTALYSARKKDEASILFNKINLFVSILVFSVMSIMAVFAKELIWIWTGQMELAEQTHLLIPIIVLAYAFLSLQIIPYTVAIANGYTKLNNVLGFSSLLVTVPGYWLSIRNYGAIGAAYIFLAVQVIITLIFFYKICKKFIITKSIGILYFLHMLFPLLISLIIALGFSFIPTWVLQHRISALAWVGFATCITFITTILVLMPKNDLRQVVNLFGVHKSICKT